MASIFSMFGQTKAYEPSPRFLHCAAPVGGTCFLWGGRVPDFSASGRKKLASTVEIFDPYLEMWEQQATSGVPPPGLVGGACVSLSDRLYSFGGSDDASWYNSIHKLDPTSLEWKELRVLNQADGPMRKQGCGMVSYNGDRLTMFGGYGIPTGPTQPGATFTMDTTYTDGGGWSNELHIYNVNQGKWSIPTTTGPRPPPCASFSFTSISDNLVVLFGGRQPGGRVNDCYVMNFETMEWTKLERPEGAPWPSERSVHAACCLNCGEDHPQVLVTGGVDKNDNTLNDMWILDVKSGRWRELTLPEGARPRGGHTVTAFSLGTWWTQVTMFGGCLKVEGGKSEDDLPKLAETTVLEFESVETPSSSGGPPTREWVLVGVTGSRQLGSNKRMREKVTNMCRVIQEFEAGRQTLQEAYSQQGLDRRVCNAEARAQELQIQLKASQHGYKECQKSFQESQAEKRELQIQLKASQHGYKECQKSFQESQAKKRDLQIQLKASQHAYRECQKSFQESQAEKRELQIQLKASQHGYKECRKSFQESQAEKRDIQIQLKASQHGYKECQKSFQESQAEKGELQIQLKASQDAYLEAQQSLQALQAEKQNFQQSGDEANAQAEALQRRVQDAESRAEEAESLAREARQGASEDEPSWVVQRDEINLTDVELGRGGWAVVHVAEFRRVHCAAKCLYRQIMSEYNQHLFIREINMAARLRHPNLLQFIGATLRGELIILTELMPTSVRGELENERTFSQNQITSISLDVARALNYLHLMQPSPIIHRDISSANVLLEPGPNNSWRAKVSDYGSVNLLERLRTAVPGNPTYAAPEAENAALQSPKMDIFSFGVLLVEMCSAQFPELADRERLIRSIQHPGMVALIRQCLAEDRNARPSASDIITELSRVD